MTHFFQCSLKMTLNALHHAFKKKVHEDTVVSVEAATRL